jgi:hypothetical protein
MSHHQKDDIYSVLNFLYWEMDSDWDFRFFTRVINDSFGWLLWESEEIKLNELYKETSRCLEPRHIYALSFWWWRIT